MDSNCSQRMAKVQIPVIPEIGKLVRDHPDCLSLGQGVVFYPPPQQIYAEIAEFGSHAEEHLYGPAFGEESLRRVIAEKLQADNHISVDADREIVVTAGANMAFIEALMAILDPGDEVILPTPNYFNHEMAIRMLNARPVCVNVATDCLPDIQHLEQAISSRTRALVTISPNNPTGVVYPPSLLQDINRLCIERGIYHISDEAYEYFTYEGARHVSPGSFAGSSNHTLCIYSLSKSYGFAGWRIGYMVVPEHLRSALLKVQDTNLICPSRIAQKAAVTAMRAGPAYCRDKLQETARVRKQVLQHLRLLKHCCHYAEPLGSFYLLLHFDSAMDDQELTRRLILEHGIGLLPGSAFGLEDDCSLRLSYGPVRESVVDECMRRFIRGIRTLIA